MHRTVFIWQMEIISKLLNKKYEQKSTSSDLYYEKEILAERFIGRCMKKYLTAIMSVLLSCTMLFGTVHITFAEGDADETENSAPEEAIETEAETAAESEITETAVSCAANAAYDEAEGTCVCAEGYENYSDEAGCTAIPAELVTEPEVSADNQTESEPDDSSIEKIPEETDSNASDESSAAAESVQLESPALTEIASYSSMNIITVHYVYGNGDSSGASAAADEEYQFTSDTVDISFPTIAGFTPFVNNGSGLETAVSYTAKSSGANQELTVSYYSNTISYTVHHAFQQLDGSYKTDASKDDIKTGQTGDYTEALPLVDIPEGYYVSGVDEQILITPQVLVGIASVELTIHYDLLEYSVIFDTKGGNPMSSESLLYGAQENIDDEAHVPARTGYVFGGWFSDPECTVGNEVTKVVMGSSDIKIYAKWNAVSAVNCTVMYWKEPVEAGKGTEDYLFVGSQIQTELAGTVIDQTYAADKGLDAYASVLDNDMSHFTYDPSKTETVTVSGTGSTIVNLYYTRNSYKISFYMDKATASMNWNGQTYSDTDVYSIQVRYQDNLVGLWPSASENVSSVDTTIASGWTGKNFDSAYISVSNRITLVAELLKSADPSVETTYTIRWEIGASKYYLHYLFNDIDDTAGCEVNTQYDSSTGCYNGKHYSETPYSQYATVNSGNWAAKVLEGVTNVYTSSRGQYETDADDPTLQHVYFLYDRNTYSIQFYNVDTMMTDQVLAVYGETISQALTKNGGLPVMSMANLPASYSAYAGAYSLDGWYANSACTTTVKSIYSNAVKNSMIFYYHWNESRFNVTFHYEDGASADTSVSVIKGAAISAVTTPTYAGRVFLGWYTGQNGTGRKYVFTSPVTANMDLYAYWVKISYTAMNVKYYGEDGLAMTGESQTGSVKSVMADVPHTEKAKIFDGYFADEAYKTITPTAGSANNVKFIYTLAAGKQIGYSIIHRIDNGDGTYAADHIETGTASRSSVTAYADQSIIDRGYLVDENSETIAMTTDAAKNIATFTYTPIDHKLTIVAKFAAGSEGNMTDLPSGNGWSWNGTSSIYTSTVGAERRYSAAIPPIAGYNVRLVTEGMEVSAVTGIMPNDDVTIEIEYYKAPVILPTPTPITPTPEPGRTCQDDGYPEGYYWNGTACVIDPTPEPEKPAPVNPADPDTPTASEPAEDVNEMTESDITLSETAPAPQVSKAELGSQGRWALINLIACIVGFMAEIVLVLSKNTKRQESEEGLDTKHTRKNGKWKIIGGIAAIAGIAIFVMTEQITKIMQLTDQYTIWMIALALANIVCLTAGRKWQDSDSKSKVENS